MTASPKRNKITLEQWFIIVQIIAIISGGIWVLFEFVIKDSSDLHSSSTITPELEVNYVNHMMHISCFVTIKNNGKTDFKVTDFVLIRVWLIPISKLTVSRYFDWEQYMNTKQAYTEAKDGVYKLKYKPNDSVRISHDFFLPISYKDSANYTVLVKASTNFQSLSFFDFYQTDSDYAYNVKIRYKQSDPGDSSSVQRKP